MTDYHVITPTTVDLVMQVIDGQLVIIQPEIAPQTQNLEESEGQEKGSE